MNCFIDELWVAVYQGLSISLCGSDEFVEHVWGKHFDNIKNVGVCPAPVCQTLSKGDWGNKVAWNTGYLATPKLAEVDHHYMASLKRFLVPVAFTMNAQTAHRVSETLSHSFSLKPGSSQEVPKYLGVHVRHGDKGVETGLFNEDQYAGMIRPYLHLFNLSLVYVASDDPDSASILRDKLDRAENLAHVVEQQRLEDKEYEWREVYKNDTALLALLVDIEALRRSEIFLGTASSNIGRLVYILRDRAHYCFSYDEDNDFLIVPPMR
jgi:hypothetical protein